MYLLGVKTKILPFPVINKSLLPEVGVVKICPKVNFPVDLKYESRISLLSASLNFWKVFPRHFSFQVFSWLSAFETIYLYVSRSMLSISPGSMQVRYTSCEDSSKITIDYPLERNSDFGPICNLKFPFW